MLGLSHSCGGSSTDHDPEESDTETIFEVQKSLQNYLKRRNSTHGKGKLGIK